MNKTVPTTKVAADSYAEKRQIQEDVAKLKANKEEKTREYNDLLDAIQDAKDRFQANPETYPVLEKKYRKRIEGFQTELADLRIEISENQKINDSLIESNNAESIRQTQLTDRKSFLVEDLEKIEATHKESTEKKNAEIKALEIAHDEEKDRLTKTREDLNTFQGQMSALRLEHEVKIGEIERGNALLNTRQEDLEIWETRLRAKYPDEVIIL